MNMIAPSVTATNNRLRKELEAYGYVFRQVDHDGWQVLLDTVPVAVGRVPQGIKGADRVAHALDKAVAEAGRHRRNFCPPDAPPAQKENAYDTQVAQEHKSTARPDSVAQAMPADASKAHPAIQKAINFLKLAGAKYHIEHDGGVYANIDLAPPPAPAKEKRQQAAVHYRPILGAQTIPFSTTIVVPEQFDWLKYEQTLRQYAYTKYGKDSCVVTATMATRSIEVMVA